MGMQPRESMTDPHPPLPEARCPNCSGPVGGMPHLERACIMILQRKLRVAERELRIAERISVGGSNLRGRQAMKGKVFRRLMDADIDIVVGIKRDILAASRAGDDRFVRYGFRILINSLEGAGRLIREYMDIGQEHLGTARTPPRWPPPHASREEILEDMRIGLKYYESVIDDLELHLAVAEEFEKTEIAERIDQLARALGMRLLVGKAEIVRRRVEDWTPELEREFRRYTDLFRT